MSSRSVVSLFNRIFDVASAACLSSSMPSPWSHLVVRCCPACPACLRLVFPSSRPISSLVVSLVVSPLFDTVGRGVRRGASVSCLLGFCPAVCADADSRFMRYLVGLLAYQIGAAGAMAFSSRPSSRPCGMCCDALLAHRLVSRLVRRPVCRVVPSVCSVLCFSRPVLRHDWRGGGRMRCACYPFCVPISSCLFRPLCLLASGRFSPSI